MKKKKATINGSAVWSFAISQWIHQGFTYLDKTEMFYRVVWEIIPFTIFYFLLTTCAGVSMFISITVSFILSHTLNWIFNYNFWTGIDFTIPKFRNLGNDGTIYYLRNVQKRVEKYDFITGCILYGSISRSVYGDKSDIDMRLLRSPGFFNGFKAYIVTFRERLIAVKSKCPMDLYLADDVKFLLKLRKDEKPVFLKCNDTRLSKLYKDVRVVNFIDVIDINAVGVKVEDLKQSIFN